MQLCLQSCLHTRRTWSTLNLTTFAVNGLEELNLKRFCMQLCLQSYLHSENIYSMLELDNGLMKTVLAAVLEANLLVAMSMEAGKP